MAKQQQTKLLKVILLTFVFKGCLLYSQRGNEEIKLLLNDSLIFKKSIPINKKKSLIIEDKKILDIITWPNKNVRNILIKQSDSISLRLGFNYVSKLVSQGEYLTKNDSLIANGLHFHYTDEGFLSHVYTYANGKLNGQYKSYHTNGILESIGGYYNGDKKGIWLYYSKKGVLLRRKFF
jgi:antitoxin component YwqK of YwqJK toxin-antitoxin module